jgi:hypothetical protein
MAMAAEPVSTLLNNGFVCMLTSLATAPLLYHGRSSEPKILKKTQALLPSPAKSGAADHE